MKRFLTVCLALCFSAPAVFAEIEKYGEEKPLVVLTVEQAIDYAIDNSKTIKAAKIDLEIAKRADAYKWNVFLPTISGAFTGNRTTNIDSTLGTMNSAAAEYAWKKSAEAGFPAAAPKWDQLKDLKVFSDEEKLHWALVGKVSASLNLTLANIGTIRASHAKYEAGLISWEKTIADTKTSIRKMFYGLLLQQEALTISETTLENARQRAAQAEKNFRNGSIPEISLLQAQVSYENQRPSVESDRMALEQSLDTFAFMIGLPIGTKIKLEGKIEPTYVDVTADTLLKQLAENNKDVMALRNQLESLKQQKSALSLGIFTPALSLNYAYQPTAAGVQNFEKWNDGGAFSATLAWTVSDMLPFSAKSVQLKDLNSNIAKVEIKLQQLLENNELTLRKTVDSLNLSRRNIEKSSRNIMLARKSYEMRTTSYRNGQTEYLDMIETETQYNQAKLGLLSEEYNYMSLLWELENAVGITLTK